MTEMRPTRVRHTVLWMTVSAYMLTYMDRQVIAAAVPSIQKEFGLPIETMGWIISAYYLGYSMFQIPGAWLGDRIGPRRALALIVTWWSVFTSLTAASWNSASMILCRFLFGVGEGGAFPVATRSLSRWMLPEERGFAQGVTHAGSRFGGAMTLAIVPWLISAFGWRAPFVMFGVLGLGWAALWYWFYRDSPAEHKSVNAAELDLIHQHLGDVRSRNTRNVPWRSILASPTLRILSVMYFCYGYCFTVYSAWFPTYLKEHRNFSLMEMGFYSSLPFLAGMVGNLMGGWLSDRWAKRSGNLKVARQGVAIAGFLLAALCITPATLTAAPKICVLLTCIALFGLELTIGVSWAIPLDIGGDFAGSVSSIMNTSGNVSAAIAPLVTAYLQRSHGWDTPFIVTAVLCVIAAALYLKIDATRRILAVEQNAPAAAEA